MPGIRHEGLEDCPQTGRNISLFQIMLLAHRANFVDQACDSLEFAHDEAPLFLILLHLL